jgi:hypothetical protein
MSRHVLADVNEKSILKGRASRRTGPYGTHAAGLAPVRKQTDRLTHRFRQARQQCDGTGEGNEGCSVPRGHIARRCEIGVRPGGLYREGAP